ncbi:extensin family protein [Niveispirillum sp.]|uniref:extensin-like domain-containing protein n=1 Tax=Niveispirillum sp. TaxID=1917217 RepID=UPI001B404D90|nr:extensin family protein [Niveispirillum sp.]MBP7337614.1 extensin family protein [Niveispirillum sp.]
MPLLLAAGAGLYAAGHYGRLQELVPARWNPWALPDPAEPPGWFTSWQLARLADDAPACLGWLERAGVAVSPVPDRDGPEPGCGLSGAATLNRSHLRYQSRVTATCPVLAGLVLYERHVLIPAAERHLGSKPVSVRHLGTYACRAVRTDRGEGGRRSQHATANAIDIAAITLADGRETVLARDWAEGDGAGPRALFWRDAHKGACGIFRTVLGPEYNALHRDHFHLDMARFGICR